MGVHLEDFPDGIVETACRSFPYKVGRICSADFVCNAFKNVSDEHDDHTQCIYTSPRARSDFFCEPWEALTMNSVLAASDSSPLLRAPLAIETPTRHSPRNELSFARSADLIKVEHHLSVPPKLRKMSGQYVLHTPEWS